MKKNEAFPKVYRRFRKSIFRYVSSRISNSQVAEEVTQEIFIKAYRFNDRYDQHYAFSTWLWTIAKNTVFDVLRKNQEPIEGSVELEDLPSPYKGAESLLEAHESRRFLFKLMKPLTKLQKRVLWMRVVQQHSYSEISKKMGLSLSAAKNLAYRAKLTLTQRLQHIEGFSKHCPGFTATA